jgi:hypothetical protein
VHVEIRDDADLLAYRTSERQRLTLPGNAYIQERTAPQPNSLDDLNSRPPITGELAVYDVNRRLPPLVLLEVDALKGRTRELARDDDWRRVWLDRQGRLRLALEQQDRRFRYLYRGADAKKWVPLDSIVKAPTALGFTIDPATLLAPRSVPLGFDSGGDKLFVATNVGRDTFGLRALDVTSGQLEEFEVGHTQYDLIEATSLTAGDAIRLDAHTGALAAVRFTSARPATQPAARARVFSRRPVVLRCAALQPRRAGARRPRFRRFATKPPRLERPRPHPPAGD